MTFIKPHILAMSVAGLLAAPLMAGEKPVPGLPAIRYSYADLPVFLYDRERMIGLTEFSRSLPSPDYGGLAEVYVGGSRTPVPTHGLPLSFRLPIRQRDYILDADCVPGIWGNIFYANLYHPTLFRSLWIRGLSDVAPVALIIPGTHADAGGPLTPVQVEAYEGNYPEGFFVEIRPYVADTLEEPSLAVQLNTYPSIEWRRLAVRIEYLPGNTLSGTVDLRLPPLPEDIHRSNQGWRLEWSDGLVSDIPTRVRVASEVPVGPIRITLGGDHFSTDTITLKAREGYVQEVGMVLTPSPEGPSVLETPLSSGCEHVNYGRLGDQFRLYPAGFDPRPLPQWPALASLTEEHWEAVTFPDHFPAPLLLAENGTLVLEEIPDAEPGSVGFWQTRNSLEALPLGAYRLRFHVQWTGSRQAQQIPPEVRFRVFQTNNARSANTVLTHTIWNDELPTYGDVLWRIAVDITAFADNMVGGVRVTGIEVIEP